MGHHRTPFLVCIASFFSTVKIAKRFLKSTETSDELSSSCNSKYKFCQDACQHQMLTLISLPQEEAAKMNIVSVLIKYLVLSTI